MSKITVAFLISLLLFQVACKDDIFHGDDEKAPRIAYVSPNDGEKNVSPNRIIMLTFDTDIDKTTVTDNNFLIKDNYDNKINGEINFYGSRLVMFTPDNITDGQIMTPFTEYHIELKEKIKDQNGTTLKNNFISSFVTGNLQDKESPFVEKVDLQNKNFNIFFSEPINPLTINYDETTSIELVDENNNLIAGKFDYNETNNSIVFIPDTELINGISYFLRIRAIEKSIADLSGNVIKNNYEFEFKNGEYFDSKPPEIVNITSFIEQIIITFNEPIKFEDIINQNTDNDSIILRNLNGDRIAASIDYNHVSNSLILVPNNSLDYSTDYLLYFNQTIKDNYDNKIEDNIIKTITTNEEQAEYLKITDITITNDNEVLITFDNEIDASTCSFNKFNSTINFYNNSGNNLASTYILESGNTVLKIIPEISIPSNTVCHVRINLNLKDVDNRNLELDFHHDFISNGSENFEIFNNAFLDVMQYGVHCVRIKNDTLNNKPIIHSSIYDMSKNINNLVEKDIYTDSQDPISNMEYNTPKVGVGENYDIYVWMTAENPPENYSIWGNVYNKNGDLINVEPIRISEKIKDISIQNHYVKNPKVLINGNFATVIYEEYNKVLARVVDLANGEIPKYIDLTLGEVDVPSVVISNQVGEDYEVTVKNDMAVVVWKTNGDIYCSSLAFSNNIHVFNTDIKVNVSTGNFSNAKVDMYGSKAIIVWNNMINQNDSRLCMRLIDHEFNDNILNAQDSQSTNIKNDNWEPSIAMTNTKAIIVWESKNNYGDTDILAKTVIFEDDQPLIWSNFTISTDNYKNQTKPKIYINNQYAIAIWQSNDKYSADTSKWHVKGRYLNLSTTEAFAMGDSDFTLTKYNKMVYTNYDPQAAIVDNKIYLIWRSLINGEGKSGIYGRILDFSPQ